MFHCRYLLKMVLLSPVLVCLLRSKAKGRIYEFGTKQRLWVSHQLQKNLSLVLKKWPDLSVDTSKSECFCCYDRYHHVINSLFCFAGISCDPPPPIQHGWNSYSSGPMGLHTLVRYSCPPAFRLIGERNLFCRSNGQGGGTWDKAAPVCEYYNRRAVCADPVVPGGHKDKTSRPPYRHGESVTFTCDANFTMKGNKTVWCQSNATWGPTPLPTCESGKTWRPSRVGRAEPRVAKCRVSFCDGKSVDAWVAGVRKTPGKAWQLGFPGYF